MCVIENDMKTVDVYENDVRNLVKKKFWTRVADPKYLG